MNKKISVLFAVVITCIFSVFALACGGGSSDSQKAVDDDNRWAGENYDYDNDNQWDDNEWNNALDDYLDENGY